jgi:hypothetical protein
VVQDVLDDVRQRILLQLGGADRAPAIDQRSPERGAFARLVNLLTTS